MSRYSVPRIYYNRKNRQEWLTSNCQWCTDEFQWKPNVSRGKFCCKECETEFNRNTIKKKIEEGKTDKRTIKKFLLEINGNVCQTCNGSEWLGKPLIMHIDHIDGNAKNNNLDNVRLLCPNCHSQTPTWGRKKRNTCVV